MRIQTALGSNAVLQFHVCQAIIGRIDHGSGNGARIKTTSGGRLERIPTTSTAGVRGTSGAAGESSAVVRDHAGSAAMGNLESAGGTLLGGVDRSATSMGACPMRRKGRILGARGGGGGGVKKIVKTSRSKSGSAASAIAPALLGVKNDIQEMVDTIKSRNPNNGGGRQAKGGPWTREHMIVCCLFPERKGNHAAAFKKKLYQHSHLLCSGVRRRLQCALSAEEELG